MDSPLPIAFVGSYPPRRCGIATFTRDLSAAVGFPHPVRTLDALHLASMEFLRAQGQPVQLASYDKRLLAAARDLNFDPVDL